MFYPFSHFRFELSQILRQLIILLTLQAELSNVLSKSFYNFFQDGMR
jgi:hypothetical protein